MKQIRTIRGPDYREINMHNSTPVALAADYAAENGMELVWSASLRDVIMVLAPVSTERHGNRHRQHCPARHHADKRGPFPEVV